MSESLMSTCFKTRDDSEKLSHVHIAVVNCWDVLSTIEFKARETGGCWDLLFAIPTWRELPSDDVEESDLSRAAVIFSHVKSEYREQRKLIVGESLDSCRPWQIDKTVMHLLVNQQVSLFDPDRDKMPAWSGAYN